MQRIILTRPAVEAGEKLGFLPGDLQNKVDPYLRPLYDALFEMFGQEAFAKLQERGVIEVAPLAYMRGRTLDDSFIILDEAQNTTREQMKMFLTRLGFNSKMVITGDITQIDLPETSKSGLIEALRVLNGVEDIAQNRFSEKDVVRHRLVQDIVRAYEKYSQANKPAEQNKKPYQNRQEERLKTVTFISDEQDKLAPPEDIEKLIEDCTAAALEEEGIDDSAEVSVTFVDNEGIRELNKEHRDIDRETDVLSFPLGDDENGYEVDPDTDAIMLGDIVISLEKASSRPRSTVIPTAAKSHSS